MLDATERGNHSSGHSSHSGRELRAWEAGYAVRRDWPDGSHEFIDFSVTAAQAGVRAERDREYWLRGPVRPRSWSVVVISQRDFTLHLGRRQCRAPDCAGAGIAVRRRHPASSDGLAAPTDGPST